MEICVCYSPPRVAFKAIGMDWNAEQITLGKVIKRILREKYIRSK